MNGKQDADSVLARATERLEAARGAFEGARDALENARGVFDTKRSDFETWQDFVERLKGLMAAPPLEASVAPPSTAPVEQPPRRIGQRGPTAEVLQTIECAEALVLERGSPVMPGQMLQLLAGHGILIEGKDPANTLAARLNRSGRFENVKGRGWWIKGKPFPNVNGSEAADPGPAASQTGQPLGGYGPPNSPA